MDFDSIQKHLTYQFAHEGEILGAVEELHDLFIQNERPLYDTPKQVSAYTLFYFLTNLPKLPRLMSYLPEGLLEDLKNMPVIDFGSGPGTLGFSYLSEAKSDEAIFLIEPKEEMRKQADQLAEAFFPHQDIRISDSLPNHKGGALIMGHVLAECSSEEILGVFDEIDPEICLLIEPGTKDVFSKILNFRDDMKRREMNVAYPCPDMKTCRVFTDFQKDRNWCHQVFNLSHDFALERLSQKLRFDRRRNPVIAHVYSRKDYSRSPQRLLRVIKETKHSFILEVCSQNYHQAQKLEIPKKAISKSEAKSLKKSDWGVDLDKYSFN